MYTQLKVVVGLKIFDWSLRKRNKKQASRGTNWSQIIQGLGGTTENYMLT